MCVWWTWGVHGVELRAFYGRVMGVPRAVASHSAALQGIASHSAALQGIASHIRLRQGYGGHGAALQGNAVGRFRRNEMSALNLRLPDSIHRHIREIAREDGVSINMFIASAVAEKISAITTEDYITRRAKRARQRALGNILDRVPKREPLPGDEI
jgi:uncharacterized protein (DUF1778 family)